MGTNCVDAGKCRRSSYVLVTPVNSDISGATGAASVQQQIHWCAEVASTMGILSVATRSRRAQTWRRSAQ